MKPGARRKSNKTAAPPRPAGVRSGGAGEASLELPEPTAAQKYQTPIWLVGLLGLMVYWGQLYMDRYGGGFDPLVFNRGESLADVEARVPKSEAQDLVVKGQRVFGTYCVACHQTTGLGTPGQFPPLVGSDWVQAPGPNRLIRIVLNGFTGAVTVKGTDFNNTMLPWRDQLSDDDIAAVLTFVRGNKDWGNNAGPVTPAQVKAIRAATATRGRNWTAPELLGIPDSGQ